MQLQCVQTRTLRQSGSHGMRDHLNIIAPTCLQAQFSQPGEAEEGLHEWHLEYVDAMENEGAEL